MLVKKLEALRVGKVFRVFPDENGGWMEGNRRYVRARMWGA
jgi:hypothetical protein